MLFNGSQFYLIRILNTYFVVLGGFLSNLSTLLNFFFFYICSMSREVEGQELVHLLEGEDYLEEDEEEYIQSVSLSFVS